MQLIHCLIIVLLVSYFPFVFGDVTTTQQLAIEGDIDAQYNLGMIYQKGTGGVSKDDIQAFYWYERSAQAGHDMAQYELAQIFFLANTENKVQSGGMYWLEESAYQGNIKAQYELGFIYYKGEGVPQNYKKSHYWFHQNNK